MAVPNLDFTVNVPTLVAVALTVSRVWGYLRRMELKINTMWIQFLLDHPDYDRRESMRSKV